MNRLVESEGEIQTIGLDVKCKDLVEKIHQHIMEYEIQITANNHDIAMKDQMLDYKNSLLCNCRIELTERDRKIEVLQHTVGEHIKTICVLQKHINDLKNKLFE